MFQLRTPRLLLRDLVAADASFIHQMAQEPAVTRYQSWLKLHSEADVRHWVRTHVGYNTRQPRHAYSLIIEESRRQRAMG